MGKKGNNSEFFNVGCCSLLTRVIDDEQRATNEVHKIWTQIHASGLSPQASPESGPGEMAYYFNGLKFHGASTDKHRFARLLAVQRRKIKWNYKLESPAYSNS